MSLSTFNSNNTFFGRKHLNSFAGSSLSHTFVCFLTTSFRLLGLLLRSTSSKEISLFDYQLQLCCFEFWFSRFSAPIAWFKRQKLLGIIRLLRFYRQNWLILHALKVCKNQDSEQKIIDSECTTTMDCDTGLSCFHATTYSKGCCLMGKFAIFFVFFKMILSWVQTNVLR